MSFATRLVARMEPWASADLTRYLNAIAAMFQPVAELAEEEGSDGTTGWVPGYGRLFNPETCPGDALAYLGQYVGTPLPVGVSEAEARQLVEAHAGFERGTRASLEAAMARVLGNSTFTILERTNPKTSEAEAYWLTIIVPKGKASNALYEAVNSVIPAGLLYEILEVSNAWIEASRIWSGVAGGLKWTEATEANT